MTKATVSVVFDNRKKSGSPVGYEQYDEITVTRQVVIGGRDKYMINGHTAQRKRVQTLFHSVQLNVNNPHFLIMQGRIVKVCNMKPQEVLSMIEEAAGTRMFEDRKLECEKTITKKQIKVDEMNTILNEEIAPTIDKLKSERTSYMKWSSNQTEIERLTRYAIAASFFEAESTLENSQADVRKTKEEIEDLKALNKNLEKQIKENEKDVEELASGLEQTKAVKYKKLDGIVSDKSKELVKVTSIWQHKKDEAAAEKKALKNCEKSIVAAEKNIKKKEQEIVAHDERMSAFNTEYTELSSKISTLQSQQLGVSMSDGNAQEKGTIAQQLMDAQKQVSDKEAEIQGMSIKVKHVTAECKEKTKEAKAVEKEFKSLSKKCATKEKELEKLEDAMKKAAFDPVAKADLEQQIVKLEGQHSMLGEAHDQLSPQLARFEFDYASPSKNFDRSKVKGLVAKMVKVKDEQASTALEIAAGGRLYNVIVDTEKTGKDLLQKGKLKKRVTIIPLNKIAKRSLNPQVVQKAQSLVGKENAKLALSLVGYDKEVEAAITYVFGTTLICTDSDAAKKVTFHKNIRTKSVTLQGDVFDPSGTLTGGSAPPAPVLMKLTKLAELEEAMNQLAGQIEDLKEQIKGMNEAEENNHDLTMKYELIKHEVALLQSRLNQSSFSHIQNEITELTNQLEEMKQASATLTDEKKAAEESVKTLEKSIKNYEKERKKQMEQAEKELKKSKAKLATLEEEKKSSAQTRETLEMELESLNEEFVSLQQQREELFTSVEALEQSSEVLADKVARKKESFDEANEEFEAERAALAEANKEIARINTHIKELSSEITENLLTIKKLQHKIKTTNSDEKDAVKCVESMLASHEWIAAEKHLFGKPHTDYDFSRSDPSKARKKLKKLQDEQEALERKVNKKVMGMFEKANQKYEELVEKLKRIEQDKQKLHRVIEEVEKKKNEALVKTWKKVNKDFGSIFSTLLPGTMAKLEPPEGKDVLDGLELKVAFNGVWKASLSELSGGQRSLLALSLILSLLLFKPAPMYILDEVDAALDLSHTQNVGSMLKTHFPHSQFIVVSLKEGMFNNANVLFRTKFVDGVSTISRTSNVGK